jgi:metacaspase-1
MTVHGLFIGINYEGTSAELGGCINDAKDYQDLFRSICCGSRTLLEQEANKANILSVLNSAIEALKKGDTLIFTYSGHGSWVPDENGDELDRRDECLCPIDFLNHQILDDELDAIFSKRKKGSRILFLSDSCHSGSVFRLLMDPAAKRKARFMPPEMFLQGKSYRKAEKAADNVLATAGHFVRRAKGVASNLPKAGLIHFSGCQDTEYSYDAVFGDRANGAFTAHFIAAYRASFTFTYNDLHQRILESLPSSEYPQSPKLNATSADRKLTVIGKV